MAHFELGIAKGGPKLHESVPDAPFAPHRDRQGLTSYSHVPVSMFAFMLSRRLRQPVLDRTGLSGRFDASLQWTPDGTPDPAPLPDLFSAMQQQLGPKLESSKALIEAIMVDHAEKTPVENRCRRAERPAGALGTAQIGLQVTYNHMFIEIQ